ncbi:MAG: UDP-N-acetylmuramate--L-alanine ligase [Acidimicrobiia bacterium]
MPNDTFALTEPTRLHIVGVGGAGMSAIALVLAGMGHQVSGSDLKESPGLDRLRLIGVDVRVGHAPENVPGDTDAVVISTAVPRSNVEVRAAEGAGIPVLRRAEVLAAIVATTRAIAVAGVHGKTTTSSMLALILREAGTHPSFIIGGELNEVGTNAAYDDGEWMVVEADESDGTFLELGVESAIVTNVEPDHLDHYGDFDTMIEAFADFLARVPGPKVVCADDPILRSIVASRPGLTTHGLTTYGWSDDADYRITDYEPGRVGSRYTLHRGGEVLGPIALPVPGRHNALNAAGAAAMATELGVGFDAIAQALGAFGGVARRFQFRGEAAGVTLVDDYAHLPGEIVQAIRAARESGWPRVVVAFQPHRYSRTGRLWREFADAFDGADQLILTDIYAAGEDPVPGVSGRLVLRAVLDAHPALPVAYFPRRTELVDRIPAYVRAGDLLLTLGAGDLTTLPDELVARDVT